VAKGRQHNLRRWTLDARVDWRPNPETSLIVGGGRTNANSSVDLTGIGAGQVTNWAYNYAQARFQWKELFAQFFMNWSDNEETYLLRSGRPLIDKSQLLVGQLQHSSRLGSNHRLVYGVDMLRTIPKSEGTINGQNEDDDDIWEVGGYAQWEWTINQKLDFVGAMRLDDHSLLQDLVFSPRAAFVYKPNQENSFRLTWNRAYSTPSTLNFFLDISSGSLPLGASGFRYDVRAQGATKNGLRFVRDDGTPRHMSPFAPFLGLEGVDQRTLLPTNAQTLWGEGLVVMGGAAQAGAITPAQFAALAQIAAPTDGDVGIIPLTLDPSLALGSDPTSDCPAPPFCLTPGGLEGVQDISPLKPTINNTIELGYTGLVAERLLIGINGWYSRITDYISALRVSTPNLFLNPVELGQYVALKLIEGGMSLAEAQQLATTTATLVGQTPLGVVTPENVGGTDATLALAYQNLGSFDLFGGEIAATYLLGDAWEIDGTFSMVSKDRFTAARGDETEEVPLNAPKYKGTAAVRFNYDNVGLNGGVRFRSQIGFPGNSGVYIGDVKGYEVFDISLGWRIPGFRELWLQLDVQNVFDTQYQPFIGTPELGRFAILRARYDWSPF
jgi:iron complex outermembrane receptor protein